MGNSPLSTESEGASQTPINRNFFNFRYPIGRGGFGRVWKVRTIQTYHAFALKEMSKARIISKRSVHSVMNERRLLASLRHPFIVNMHFAFQDRENLYLVMDLLTGGDLRYHIGRQRRFSEEQTKFFICCIVHALEYVHNNNVIHRDIKPENLVIDDRGYVRVTDFGIARIWQQDNARDTSGTPGYMAPEVMCRMNHTIAVDYFAVGVIGYEFMLGRRPYLGRNRREIRDAILAKQVQIKPDEAPVGWSAEGVDFINKLIQRKPGNRLGYNGPQEVKQHPWIRNFTWDKLQEKAINAPFKPIQKDNFDARVRADWDDQLDPNIILQESVQEMFSGYNFDIRDFMVKETAKVVNRRKPRTSHSRQSSFSRGNFTGKNFTHLRKRSFKS